MNYTKRTIATLGIIVIVISCLVYVARRNKVSVQPKEDRSSSASSSNSDDSSEILSPMDTFLSGRTAVTTTNWNVYNNKQKGIHFRYPDTLRVKESGSELWLLPVGEKFEEYSLLSMRFYPKTTKGSFLKTIGDTFDEGQREAEQGAIFGPADFEIRSMYLGAEALLVVYRGEGWHAEIQYPEKGVVVFPDFEYCEKLTGGKSGCDVQNAILRSIQFDKK